MMGIHPKIGSFASSIVDRFVRTIPSTSEELRHWAEFHGWGADVDGQVVARQAVLNLMLRALICYILDPDDLPSSLRGHFIVSRSDSLLKALGIAPCPFSYLDHLALKAEVVLGRSEVVELTEALRHEQGDVLGSAYLSWVPQDARRTLGQFWTPMPIAQLMTRWAVRSADDHVLDPAFGSGVFLSTAIDRLKYLGASKGTIAKQLAGVELSPLVFLVGLTNVLLRHGVPIPRLLWGDFLMPEREPYEVIKEPSEGYFARARQMVLPGIMAAAPVAFPDKFDAIVCNPPYTRHHHLPETYKSTWTAMMKHEYGIKLSRFSSLFTYFLVQASRMLKPGGRMAFITPATAFEAFYGREIKSFIQRNLYLRAIISFDEDLSVFEGVDTAACITLLEGPGARFEDRAVHIRVRRWPGVEPILQLIEEGRTSVTDWGYSHELKVSCLKPDRKWTVLVHEGGRHGRRGFVPLSALARIMRGIATGANYFFVLSDDEVARWGLKYDNLRPVLTKTREVPGYVFTGDDFDRLGREGKKRWLLYLTGPVVPGTAEAEYIRYGEEHGLHERSLVRTRSIWYMMEKRDPAPIYFTYLSRKRPRFIYNRTDALALNVFLCIYPKPEIAEDEAMLKALLAILNSLTSRDSLRHVGRTYGGDTIKLEPREMDQLSVLDPSKLTVVKRGRLSELFDQLCLANSKEDEESVLKSINEEIVELL